MTEVRIIPMLPIHLHMIEVQPMQADTNMEDLWKACENGENYTAIANDCIIGMGGFFLYQGSIAAWAVLSAHAGKHMLALTRIVRKKLTEYQSVYTLVNAPAGYRWADMLGLKTMGKGAVINGKLCEYVCKQQQ